MYIYIYIYIYIYVYDVSYMYNIDTEMTCGGCMQRKHRNKSQRDEPPYTRHPHHWLHCTCVLTMVIESGMETNKSMILLRNQNATPKRNNNTRLSAAELQNATQNASPERSAKCPNHTNLYFETISLKTQFRNARTV